jgi:acetylcholinesterase
MGLKLSTKANLLAVLQVLLALEALSSPAATVSAPIINLGYAQYQGSIDTATNTTSFLGIRYAAPPVGAFSLVYFTISAHAPSA